MFIGIILDCDKTHSEYYYQEVYKVLQTFAEVFFEFRN